MKERASNTPESHFLSIKLQTTRQCVFPNKELHYIYESFDMATRALDHYIFVRGKI